MSRGIHSRGYLPHWDFPKSVQAITFRLADSVPIQVIRKWKRELADILDDKQRTKQIHRQIARYEDAGHGDAVLIDPACAALLQDVLIEGHGDRYKLIAWVIMPNHVHAMIRLLEGQSLTSIVQRWKGASSRHINRHLMRDGRLWSADYHDRYIRDIDHYYDALAYIRNNPVKAGPCDKPEDWAFSSAGASWSADFSPHEAPSEQALPTGEDAD